MTIENDIRTQRDRNCDNRLLSFSQRTRFTIVNETRLNFSASIDWRYREDKRGNTTLYLMPVFSQCENKKSSFEKINETELLTTPYFYSDIKSQARNKTHATIRQRYGYCYVLSRVNENAKTSISAIVACRLLCCQREREKKVKSIECLSFSEPFPSHLVR